MNTPIKLIYRLISCSEYCSDMGVSEKMYVMNSLRYATSIHRGLLSVVCDTKVFWMMTPQPTRKRLGV